MTRAKPPSTDQENLSGLAGETVRAVQRITESRPVVKAAKTADKAEKKAAKQLKKATKKSTGRHRRGKDEESNITIAPEAGRFTPKKARNAVGVAKVLAPVIIPIMTPLAVRSAGAVREGFDRYRAHRLGVEVGRLGDFTGRGASLSARIEGISEGVADLSNSARATESDKRFAEETRDTLSQLAASVRATEPMPTRRRKAAHRAVATELDNLEKQLLARLGVQS